MSPGIPDRLLQLYDLFSSRVGAHSDLGLLLDSIDESVVRIILPFQNKHSTSPRGGSLHSSLLLTAIDSACGFAVG